MTHILVDLNISAEEWLKIYRGTARIVRARTRDGRGVQFPANILQRFVRHEGIQGRFLIEYDLDGKFKSVSKIAGS